MLLGIDIDEGVPTKVPLWKRLNEKIGDKKAKHKTADIVRTRGRAT
jgi:hypothetical protein